MCSVGSLPLQRNTPSAQHALRNATRPMQRNTPYAPQNAHFGRIAKIFVQTASKVLGFWHDQDTARSLPVRVHAQLAIRPAACYGCVHQPLACQHLALVAAEIVHWHGAAADIPQLQVGPGAVERPGHKLLGLRGCHGDVRKGERQPWGSIHKCSNGDQSRLAIGTKARGASRVPGTMTQTSPEACAKRAFASRQTCQSVDQKVGPCHRTLLTREGWLRRSTRARS